MSIIKYTAKFKRPLFIKTPKGNMVVGEVENFQQNLDGTLDIVAFIWPQVPKQLREQIEKNPGIMGMTAETQPVTDHLVFPDGTKFDTVDDPTWIDPAVLLKRIENLEASIGKVRGRNPNTGECEHEYISHLDNSAICRKCGYRP